ncbi:MAG: xanthine dehydrogenase family protein molybdopterin-binding subunit, partial [Thermomicrobiales bacterium]|nr:xanthine dehydrogenase family protein molybdopterin-binding subunit [Thermomicrobiales bacterium]
EEGVAPWSATTPMRVVGQPYPRLEGGDKVSGRARYASDIRLPGLLYARVLRSPHPHARIARIDTSRAERAPGVHAVLSLLNTPDMDWFEEGKLFDRTVRYIGDEVAAVAAEREEAAEDALRLIDVTYEPLPFVMTATEALAEGAPPIHPGGNIAGEVQTYERGDLEAGFRQADVVVAGTFTTPAALHNALEAHGCTAFWDGDHLTLWDSTQAVFVVREQVAEKLGLSQHHVRVIKEHMGGGFGAKQISWKPDVLAALLSREAGRPVQLILDRRSENLASGNRNPTRQRLRIGAKRDGTLTALEAVIQQEVGAYRTGGEASNVSGPYKALYQCPNVRTEQTPVYTNTGPAVAFRAPGYAEGAFALEQVMDDLAHTLGLDPVTLRERNYARTDQESGRPYSLPDGLRLCYGQVGPAYAALRAERDRNLGGGASKRRGVGFAAHDWVGGHGDAPGYAWVELNSDGTVTVITGTQDIGSGTRTGLAQVAAEELGLPLADISLQLGDTARGPYAPVSSGSATQATIGPAVRSAAADLRRQVVAVAAALLETQRERLSLQDGQVLVDDKRPGEVSVAEVASKVAPHMLRGEGARAPNPGNRVIRTFGAQCVAIEVDTATGDITVERVVTAHDCGRIVNPTLLDSQITGGVIQGVGFALTEERVTDDARGYVLNANLENYYVPTVQDIPVIEPRHVGVPDSEANSTGAKGIGEPPLIPTAPAIANAFYDATGVRIRDLPLTRRRVLAALADRHAAEGAQ